VALDKEVKHMTSTPLIKVPTGRIINRKKGKLYKYLSTFVFRKCKLDIDI
jgi:hypothetical protein